MNALLLICALQLAAADPALANSDFLWREEFQDAGRWTAQPAWLGNGSAAASAKSDGNAVAFHVVEPRHGMKWSSTFDAISTLDLPWLVLRYKAQHLDTKSSDYLVYVRDSRGRELYAIRLCDARCDGQWHVAAVDLSAILDDAAITVLALQVQSDEVGNAQLTVDWLAAMESPPEGADIASQSSAGKLAAPLTISMNDVEWTPQPSWLGNAADKHEVAKRESVAEFKINRPSSGMKWSWNPSSAINCRDYRYLAVRYRATGASSAGDYFLCLLGDDKTAPPGYASAIAPAELTSDGRWHTLNVSLRQLAKSVPAIRGIAIQLQSDSSPAKLEVSDIRFVQTRTPNPLLDVIAWKPGAAFQEDQPVSIQNSVNSDSSDWQRHLVFSDWFSSTEVTVEGIPLRLAQRPSDLASTRLSEKQRLQFPVNATASEIYVLLLAAFNGNDEPVFGEGKLRAIKDVDRFRMSVEYTDGTRDDCLPMNVVTRRFGVVAGPQMLVLAAEPKKTIKFLTLQDDTRQGAFAVAGITLHPSSERRFPDSLENDLLWLRANPAARQRSASLAFRLADNGLPFLESISDTSDATANLLSGRQPLIGLKVDGQSVAVDKLQRIADNSSANREKDDSLAWFSSEEMHGLALGLRVSQPGADSLRIDACVTNSGTTQHTVMLESPRIGPYRLSSSGQPSFYLVPRRGSVLESGPASFRERYCGLFPVQFLDTFCPEAGHGLSLRTLDTDCLRKYYRLEKDQEQFTLGVEYPDQKLEPGATLSAAPAIVKLTDGDWHRGLEAYRNWMSSWNKPASPRKPWFREVFNFRQRFLWTWDPLYDADKGELNLNSAVEEARREFGGMDYLHLFDWGYYPGLGRIYGRTGDKSPYEALKGGQEALRGAISGVQIQRIPVGLYIEGYLLEERGLLGQKFGKSWQLIDSRKAPVYWPESTEMMICPAPPAWSEVQASTYATKIRELNVDGMYLDQFGFSNVEKDCWSDQHGHAVPSYCVATERDTTRRVRQSMDQARPNVALYTEETPVDVTTQNQDGSFTYAMSSSLHSRSAVPLNMARFAFPDFKTIEILVCDKPTGSWATGVKWVFFNGEAIWLEGKADEWFEPETRQAIRQCHALLRKHKDAFTGLQPSPLVPTEVPGVFANAFRTNGKTVYTLYNSRHRTIRGPVLRVPHAANNSYSDEWHRHPAEIRIDAQTAILSTDLGPQDVGCLVVQTKQ
jgi:hypothetical protein